MLNLVSLKHFCKRNLVVFAKDLGESKLLTDPPAACDELFVCYDETLSRLLDKHAPLKKSTRRTRTTAPWFNSVCRQVKVKSRRLKQIYRSKNTVIAYREWRLQLDVQRHFFQTAYSDYWSKAINSCADSKTL